MKYQSRNGVQACATANRQRPMSLLSYVTSVYQLVQTMSLLSYVTSVYQLVQTSILQRCNINEETDGQWFRAAKRKEGDGTGYKANGPEGRGELRGTGYEANGKWNAKILELVAMEQLLQTCLWKCKYG